MLVRQFQNQTQLKDIEAPDTQSSPMRLPQQETSMLTNEILSALPDAQRQTIEMVFFQGLTFKEIAQKRSETFSNVRHHYYRRLQRLRDFLEKGVEQKDAKSSTAPIGEVSRAET